MSTKIIHSPVGGGGFVPIFPNCIATPRRKRRLLPMRPIPRRFLPCRRGPLGQVGGSTVRLLFHRPGPVDNDPPCRWRSGCQQHDSGLCGVASPSRMGPHRGRWRHDPAGTDQKSGASVRPRAWFHLYSSAPDDYRERRQWRVADRRYGKLSGFARCHLRQGFPMARWATVFRRWGTIPSQTIYGLLEARGAYTRLQTARLTSAFSDPEPMLGRLSRRGAAGSNERCAYTAGCCCEHPPPSSLSRPTVQYHPHSQSAALGGSNKGAFLRRSQRAGLSDKV